jgi:hypothetical protein
MIRQNRRGLEHASGGPAPAHVALAPALEVAAGAADDLDNPTYTGWSSTVFSGRAGDPSAGEGECLIQSLAQRAGGVRPRALKLGE